VVADQVQIQVRARTLLLDYAGLSDGRSMRTLLCHVAPRHLVLAAGLPQARIACLGLLRTPLKSSCSPPGCPRRACHIPDAQNPIQAPFIKVEEVLSSRCLCMLHLLTAHEAAVDFAQRLEPS
jgi:hypothetical protein